MNHYKGFDSPDELDWIEKIFGVDPPEGYRILQEDEYIRHVDLFLDYYHDWVRVSIFWESTKFKSESFKIIATRI